MSDQPVTRLMFTVKGAINLGFGAGLLIAPAPLIHLYGISLDPVGQFLERLFGAACLGIGVVQVFGRNAPRGELQSLLVAAFAIADLIGFMLAVAAMLAGYMNALGWAVTATYAFAGFGFALAWLKECRSAGRSPATAL